MLKRTFLELRPKLQAAVLNGNLNIILGSASPRRLEALTLVLGGEEFFEVLISNFHEELSHIDYPGAIQYCMVTAEEKAKELCHALRNKTQKTLIITADTVVELDGQILEKPKSKEDAVRMLTLLSDKEHLVHTSIVLYELPKNIKGFAFSVTTKVKFAALNQNEILAYIATGEPMDKSGSYGVQGDGRFLIEWIQGDFYNVVGFPAREFVEKFAYYLDKILD